MPTRNMYNYVEHFAFDQLQQSENQKITVARITAVTEVTLNYFIYLPHYILLFMHLEVQVY